MRHTRAPDAHDLQRRPVDRLFSALARHRRGGRRIRAARRLAALALLVVAAVLATTRSSPASEGAAVQAASRDLPAGATLTPPDLHTTVVPAPPDGAVPARSSPTGRVLAAPVRRGEILTDVRLLGDEGPRAGPGRAAVPVRPGDAGTAALLHPGMRVAVIGVDPNGTARTLTADAVVLSVPPAGAGAGSNPGGRLVVLSVPERVADAITATALTGTIGLRFA